MPATVDKNGVQVPTQEELEEDVNTDLKGEFGETLDTTTGFLARFNKIILEKKAKAYELLLDLYNNSFPDKAVGEALSAIAALTGTVKKTGTKSTVVCTLELDDGTYNAGTLVFYKNGSSDEKWENRDDITISGGANPETSTGHVFVAQEVGPQELGEGLDENDLTTSTNVTGWSDNTTPVLTEEDADIGQDPETDEELRLRRESELARPGTGTVPAIRADMLDVDGADEVLVIENDSETTDGDGRPPHSFEVVFYDGTSGGTNVTDQTIADALWAAKPAGIATHGGTSETVEGADGEDHTVNFSRPTQVTVHFEVDLTKDPDTYSVDSDVQDEIVALAQSILSVGDDVYASKFYEAVFDVDGVVDVTKLECHDSSPTSGNTSVTISRTEIADVASGNITVTSIDA